MKKVLGILLKTLVPLALGIYLFWFFFQSMDEETKNQFYHALKTADYFWIIASMLLSVLALFSRAYRWKYLLEPLGYKTSFWNRYHALMVGYVMNLTIPRAGEATRSLMLQRSDNVPFASSFGTIVAERVFDVLMLGLVALTAFLLASDDFLYFKKIIQEKYGSPESTGFPWFKVIAGCLLAGLMVVLILVKSLRSKISSFVLKMIQGVFGIFKTKHPLSFIGHTLFIWALYLIYFWICFFALPETSQLGLKPVLLGFVAGSLGISLTNGGIGVFPLLVGAVISYYLNVENGQGVGVAIGMLIWSSQTVLIILLGVTSFFLLPKNYSKDDTSQTNNG